MSFSHSIRRGLDQEHVRLAHYSLADSDVGTSTAYSRFVFDLLLMLFTATFDSGHVRLADHQMKISFFDLVYIRRPCKDSRSTYMCPKGEMHLLREWGKFPLVYFPTLSPRANDSHVPLFHHADVELIFVGRTHTLLTDRRTFRPMAYQIHCS